MVIDTGISKVPEITPYLATSPGANDQKDLTDIHGHGTHITGTILYGRRLNDPVCSAVKIYSCKIYFTPQHSSANCFRAAKSLGIHVINYSGGGVERDASEAAAIRDFKGIIVAAAGNENSDLKKTPYYPGSLNGVIMVGNGRSSSERYGKSNYGLDKLKWRAGDNVKSLSNIAGERATMSGSSMSTALYTHDLLKSLCHRLESAK